MERNNEAPSGSGANFSKKPYNCMETLSFLNDCKDSRETVGNISYMTTDEDDIVFDCSLSTFVSSNDNNNNKKQTKRKADAERQRFCSDSVLQSAEKRRRSNSVYSSKHVKKSVQFSLNEPNVVTGVK